MSSTTAAGSATSDGVSAGTLTMIGGALLVVGPVLGVILGWVKYIPLGGDDPFGRDAGKAFNWSLFAEVAGPVFVAGAVLLAAGAIVAALVRQR